MARAYVSIGSNIEPECHMQLALVTLEQAFGPLTCSSIITGPAVGFEGPDFHNAVVGFDTELSYDELAASLREIEYTLGRPGNAQSFTSRVIDIDLLLFDNLVLFKHNVEIPRSDILKYAFVLQPLAEIAGNECHPLLGKTYAELWELFSKEVLNVY